MNFVIDPVAGPLELISYIEDVVEIIKRNLVIQHLFADDKEILAPAKLSEIDIVRMRLRQCIADVRGWCDSRRLQLNASKTELVWFGSHINLHKLSNVDSTLSY